MAAADELERLARLRDSGVLSQAEFLAQKQKVLGDGVPVAPAERPSRLTFRNLVMAGSAVFLFLLMVGRTTGGGQEAVAPSRESTPAPAPAKPSREQQIADQAAASARAEDERKGFHCLSTWDGSNRDLVRQVKDGLRDPDSFEQIDTTIGPVSAASKGKHPTEMRYRARNGFGGMNVGTVFAFVDHETCKATIAVNVDR